MIKLKHIQGPWENTKVAHEDGSPQTIDEMKTFLSECVDNTVNYPGSAENLFIVMAPCEPDGPVFTAITGNGPTSEANARLIAAAPEMLEHLIEYYEDTCLTCKMINPHHKNCTSCRDQEHHKELIEKATGLKIEELLK